MHRNLHYGALLGICACAVAAFAAVSLPRAIVIEGADPAAASSTATSTGAPSGTSSAPQTPPAPRTPIDKAAYDAKMLDIANLTIVRHVKTIKGTSSTPTSTIVTTSTTPLGWPVKAAYPNTGALLPFNRIVAYYGNFYSTQMGVLGQYPEAEMVARLASTTAAWAAADPTTPVIPAVDYIAVTAQASAGSDGKYRARMPDDQIEKAVRIANEIKGIVVLDVQVGLSNVQTEVPLLGDYLKLPNVHLALDPEFAMHGKEAPGTVIGTLDAKDINFAANYLADLVRKNNLPPKILIIHRFTQAMVTNARNITPLPEVQIVMDMDGFGSPSKKLGTYTYFIQAEPVQFTGFKLFYKNDVRAGHIMTPEEVLELSPQPAFIQYQ